MNREDGGQIFSYKYYISLILFLSIGAGCTTHVNSNSISSSSTKTPTSTNSKSANATSLSDAKLGNLYRIFYEAGVPKKALEYTFQFLRAHQKQAVPFTTPKSLGQVPRIYQLKLRNFNYAAVIDYSLPSTNKRLFLLNLTNGTVQSYLVSHGKNTGENYAQIFSNQIGSYKTSLGAYYTGRTYSGSHGESLYMMGLEKTNDNAYERTIVMHGADYVTPAFIRQYGRLGRSLGCFVIEPRYQHEIISKLDQGALLVAYHPMLSGYQQKFWEAEDFYDFSMLAPESEQQN